MNQRGMDIVSKKAGTALIMSLLSAVMWVGCVEDTNEGAQGEELSGMNEREIDVNRSNVVNVGGELFSVPSPIETALMMKESGAHFDNALMNDPEKASQYASKSKKALNLGVYGADLGYVTIYDNPTDALKYLKVVERLLDDLGVTGAFNEEILSRFSNNVGNQDSLLVLVGESFKAGDTYLKDNERNDVAGFILAGGFVEALYFATNVAHTHGNEQIIKRIGEQKESLGNLVKLLMHNYDHEEHDLIMQLKELQKSFETIEYSYKYVAPEVHPEDKMTYVLSETNVDITHEDMENIRVKVEEIRNYIIQ